MTKNKYNLHYKNISDLTDYINNSRTHSEEQITQIAGSIKEFGFTNPVLIDSENGIIAGHGRVLAANKLNMKEVPCIVLDGLSDMQKRAYIIADNKLALNSGWDDELLRLELSELDFDMDFDFSIMGFEDIEITNLLNENTSQLDVEKEWTGMPEFDQKDKTAFRSLLVHFKNQEDVDDFQKLIKQKLTDKTKSIWHPKLENRVVCDKNYE